MDKSLTKGFTHFESREWKQAERKIGDVLDFLDQQAMYISKMGGSLVTQDEISEPKQELIVSPQRNQRDRLESLLIQNLDNQVQL